MQTEEKAETIEERLKHLILARYKSVLAFSKVVGLSNQTVVSILNRGIMNSGVGNMIKICKCLEISLDALGEGEIVFNEKSETNLNAEEQELIRQYRTLDKAGQRRILRTMKGEYDDAIASFEKDLPNATGAG